MAKEIERKYLVRKELFDASAADSACHMVQAYISTDADATVRVRVINDAEGRLTVKGRNQGATRNEWEYAVPVADALDMLRSLPVKGLIDKTRYRCGRWEVDFFHGRLEGLAVAEIELSSADEEFTLPAFAGREVTDDPRYYNSSLGSASSSSLPPFEA